MNQQTCPCIKRKPLLLPARRGFLLCVLGVALALSTSPRGTAAFRLRNTAPSGEALATQVLAAMVKGDTPALRRLALSEQEFRQYVWPELPVSNPRTHVTFDFVWKDVAYRSGLWMERLEKDLRGSKARLARVVRRGEIVRYRNYRAWSDMKVVLADESGLEREYPLFGTLIEMDGRFKVYSYAPYD
jgi:hypothetical protein